MAKSQEIAPTVTESRVTNWWAEAEADEVEGYDLIRDQALLEVVGVPFMVFNAVYRDGVQRKESPYQDDYVSIEFRVAPYNVLAPNLIRINSRRAGYDLSPLDQEDLISLSEEQLVLNDGSTGVYRQITQYLDAKGLITLPDGPKVGEKGGCIYDLPRSQWLDGDVEATEGIRFELRCMRGLRFSDYETPYGEARTWYIA